MDLTNLTADEKLQKYNAQNEEPEMQLGGIDYIPNETPPSNNIDFTSLLANTKSPLTSLPFKQKVAESNTELPEIADKPNDTARPADVDDDPWNVMMKQANKYRGMVNNTGVDSTQLKREIAKVESEGMGGYKAQNAGSSAVGKYQFLWGSWGDAIKRYTGVNTPEQFKNSPDAQEQFFDYYQKTVLQPQLSEIKKEYPDSGLSDTDLMKLLHFRGIGKRDQDDGGLRTMLRKGTLNNKVESNNLSAMNYLKNSKS